MGDDQTGVQSNAPITTPAEVEIVDETKYLYQFLCVALSILGIHVY